MGEGDLRVSAPLSVVTLGNSVAVLQLGAEAGIPRRTYSDVLADALNEGGVPATVALEGKWFDFLKDAILEWEQRVRPHRPQVLIVQYGLNESQPWLAPVWLIRHLLRKEEYTTRAGKLYRRTLGTWMWKSLRNYRRVVSPLVGTATWQTTPRRFESALRRLIHLASAERGCLVLILDINPPGGTLTHFLPGQEKRHAIYQSVFERVVESTASRNVRLVRASTICEALGGRGGLPDGMHFSAAAHEAVGMQLSEEIFEWIGYRREKNPRTRATRK